MTETWHDEPPTCIYKGCLMTLGFYIGGRQHVCWLHALVPPFACIKFDQRDLVGLRSQEAAQKEKP